MASSKHATYPCFTSLMLLGLTLSVGAAQAVTTSEVGQAASAAIGKKVEIKPAGATGAVKVPATAGGIAAKGGGNEYPSGTSPIPPKPKKEGLEAVSGVAIKGGGTEYPSGTSPIPPKPKKDALEAAGALKAKAAP